MVMLTTDMLRPFIKDINTAFAHWLPENVKVTEDFYTQYAQKFHWDRCARKLLTPNGYGIFRKTNDAALKERTFALNKIIREFPEYHLYLSMQEGCLKLGNAAWGAYDLRIAKEFFRLYEEENSTIEITLTKEQLNALQALLHLVHYDSLAETWKAMLPNEVFNNQAPSK